jgi:hypothetical protein
LANPATVINSKTKFQRNYVFTATGPRFVTPLVISTPFTIEFDIQRNSYTSTNLAHLRLYNISLYNRNLLTLDQFENSLADAIYITLSAGYGAGPYYPAVFIGNAQRAYSIREGTNFITVIDGFAAGLAYQLATSSVSWLRGQSYGAVIAELLNDLSNYGVAPGVINSTILAQTFDKGGSLSGNTIDLLRQLTNKNFFIDNGKANILLPGDAIANGPPILVNAQSGLLQTPIKENTYILWDMLFEPGLNIGNLIDLESSTGVNIYNGIHKVIGIQHKGMISSAVSGDAITSLQAEAGVFNSLIGTGK